jgi:CDP-diacylglycerol---serine O-phosphatidyltransferase
MVRKSVPSLITSMNLFSGCVSVLFASSGNLYIAGIMIIAAAFFDFFDGMAARLMNSVSEFGKQLDSLADMVSFGLAPSMIIYRLLTIGTDSNIIATHETLTTVLYCAPFLVAVFSALRLAKFNIDPDQANSFKGLPTPANALLIAGFGFAVAGQNNPVTENIVTDKWFLIIFIIISCFLLVSRIGMFSLKFRNLQFRGNIIRYFFLLASAIMLMIFGLTALSFIIVLYVLLSVFTSGRALTTAPEKNPNR